MKIRVMKSQTAIDMVEAFGGSPTPISFGELFTALQQGLVDGAENNPPSFITSRHYEVCKYYAINEHTSVPDVLLISTKIWEGLSDDERKWLTEAAQESAVEERKLWAASEIESIEKLKAAGVEIIYPDKSKFADKVTQLYDSYKNDAELYGIINKIKQTE
jgi:TRAP-type C4-dicarboxylate transport system substrate-binding protein